MSRIKKIRLKGVDLARGLAILFMISVHVLELYSTPSTMSSTFGEVIDFLGGPLSAPVFMLLMGLSFVYASKKDLLTGLKRGVSIFLLGYVLNFFNGVLPTFIYKITGTSIHASLTPMYSDYLTPFLLIDILQFAGIAYVIMVIFREVRLSNMVLAVIALAVAVISPYLWSIKFKLSIIGYLADLLWGDIPVSGFISNLVAFPVFPWLTFPLVGMILGNILSRTDNTAKTFNNIALVGVVIMILGIIIILTNPKFHINDYYHSRQGAIILMTGLSMLWLSLCSKIVAKVKNNFIFNILFSWSKNVTKVYIIQWLLITWGTFILGINNLAVGETVILIISISAITHLISVNLTRLKRHKQLPILK